MLEDIVAQYLTDLGVLAPRTARGPSHATVSHYKWRDIASFIAHRIDLLYDGGRRQHAFLWCEPTVDLSLAAPPEPGRKMVRSGLPLSPEIVADVTDLAEHGVRWVYLFVFWDVLIAPYGGAKKPLADAHATMLLVDTQERVCRLFDPNDGAVSVYDPGARSKSRSVDLYDALRGRTILPGYRYAADRRQPLPSLQARLEKRSRKLGHPLRGLCMLLTVLVLVVCLRLQYADPWGVAHAIRDAVDRWAGKHESRREAVRSNLATWYRRVYTQRTWEALEAHVGLTVHHASADGVRRCAVWSDDQRSFCRRRNCPRHAMCNQHRAIVLFEQWHRRKGGAAACTHPIPWSKNGSVPRRVPDKPPIVIR